MGTPLNFSLLHQRNIFGLPSVPQETPDYNLFGVNPQPEPNYNLFGSIPDFSQVQAPPDDITALMNRLYTPETGMSQRFAELLGKYPQRTPPGKLRQIGAVAMGLRNASKNANPLQTAELQERFLHPGYSEKVEDWKNQITPSYQAANLERYSNANERQMAYQTAQAETSRKRADITERAQEEKERSNLANEEIRQQRANVYAWKAENPNLRFDTSGPTVLVMDPADGKIIDTKIPTGSLTEQQKIYLQHGYRMQEIVKRGEVAEKVKSIPPGGTGGANKPESPNQTKIRQYNAARQMKSTRKDLDKLIELGTPGTNDFKIKNGGTPQQYNDISQAIYGKPAYVRAKDKNGRLGWVQSNQWEAAKKQGYTEVK